MKITRFLPLFLSLLLAAFPLCAEELTPLLQRKGDAAQWSGWVRYGLDRREMVVDGQEGLLEVDLDHLVGRLGYRVHSSVEVYGEAGSSKAEQDAVDGQRGFEWALGLRTRVFEHVMEDNPVAGPHQRMGLEADLQFRSMESNFPEADFTWEELRFIPSIYYTRSTRGQAGWHPYRPESVTARAGLVYNSLEGELGDAAVEGNRDFALQLGFDLGWQPGWTTRVQGVFFGSKDREISIATGFTF